MCWTSVTKERQSLTQLCKKGSVKKATKERKRTKKNREKARRAEVWKVIFKAECAWTLGRHTDKSQA